MLLSNLNLLANTPDGVAKLRELILTLAVQGKLVPQDPSDEPASELLKKIRTEKDRLIAEGKIKRDKPLAEIAVGEKPFGLPQGWEWAPLQYIGYTQTGTTPDKKNPEFYGIHIPFIKPGDIYPGYVDYDNEALSERGLKDSGRVAPAGSILMVCIGTIGKTNIIERDCSFNQQINSITPLCCLPEFIGLYLRCPEFQSQAWARSASTTIAILNKGNWEQIPVALPPLAEQSRIVTRVEELMRLCDALEAKARLEATQHAQLVATLLSTLTTSNTPKELTDNWHRVATHFDLLLDRPEAVDALEQTILQLAVRGLLVPQDPKDEPAYQLVNRLSVDSLAGLPPAKDDIEAPFPIPGTWSWVPLASLAGSMANGLYKPAKFYSETGTTCVRMYNIQDGELDLAKIMRLEVTASELDQYALEPGDLLVNRVNSRELVGKCAIVSAHHELLVYEAMNIRIRLVETVNMPSYVNLVLRTNRVRKLFQGDAKQAVGQASINQSQVGNVAIPLPPLAEQSRIVARVASLRALCADLRQRLTTARTQQALLAQVLVENSV